jgi:hypothetical protein
MQLLSNIQFSIYNIFELYKTQGKRWLGFSTLFTILSTISTALLICTVLLIFQLVWMAAEGANISFSTIIDNPQFIMDFKSYVPFMSVMNLGIYGIFLHYKIGNPTEKITFSSFFKSISGTNWWLYFVFSSVGILVSRLLYLLLNPSPQEGLDQLITYVDYTSNFEDWLCSIGRMVVDQLPILLVFLLLRNHFSSQGVTLSKSAAKIVFLALLILYFAVSNFSVAVLTFISGYIFSLIRLPFQEELIPTILSVSAYVIIASAFLPGLAAALTYPFLHSFERETILHNEQVIEDLAD